MLSVDHDSNVVCKICRRQIARYTCPACNLPYCSLTCFRSSAHTNCSEAFYKKELEVDIRSQPSKTTEERSRMMEILKRFEEDDLENSEALEDSDDDDDLVRRFEGIDLESATPDALWSILSSEEKAKFVKAMDNPSSDLARQLLASEELQKETRKPWWEASSEIQGDLNVDIAERHGEKPDLIRVPLKMVKPAPVGPPLIYNLCAICVAYAFTTRRLAISPLCSIDPVSSDIQEAKHHVSQLVPFLAERKATTLYTSVSAMMTDIWSRFDEDQISQTTFSLLMRDTATLIQPLPVGEISTSELPKENVDINSHPNRMPVLVLSDLYRMYNPPSRRESKIDHVAHKLLYYAAHILSTPPIVLRSLANEIAVRSMDTMSHDASSGVKSVRPENETLVEAAHETRGLISEL